MKPTITLVVDRATIETVSMGADAVERKMKWWHIRDLAAALIAAGADAPIFLGGLDEAPESWAYVLLTGWLEPVAANPAVRARFPRTLAILGLREACKDAEQYGLAGALTDFSLEAYESAEAARKRPHRSVLCVKRDIAARLGWPVYKIDSSPSYDTTAWLDVPFANVMLTYLTALLGEP